MRTDTVQSSQSPEDSVPWRDRLLSAESGQQDSGQPQVDEYTDQVVGDSDQGAGSQDGVNVDRTEQKGKSRSQGRCHDDGCTRRYPYLRRDEAGSTSGRPQPQQQRRRQLSAATASFCKANSAATWGTTWRNPSSSLNSDEDAKPSTALQISSLMRASIIGTLHVPRPKEVPRPSPGTRFSEYRFGLTVHRLPTIQNRLHGFLES